MTKNSSSFILAIVLVTGILFSGISSWVFYTTNEKTIIQEFNKEIDEYSTTVYREMTAKLETLYTLSILFHGKTVAPFARFRNEAKGILNRHTGIQALAWVPRIDNKQRADFEYQQQQIISGFKITQKNEQGQIIDEKVAKEYFPITYLEPIKNNIKALGFNLGSNKLYFDTLSKVMNTHKPLATPAIILVQNNNKQKGFLVAVPVYKDEFSVPTIKIKTIKGFVIGMYNFDTLFPTSSLDDEYDGIEIKIVDKNLNAEKRILKIHHEDNTQMPHESISYIKDIPEILGQEWSLIAIPSKAYIQEKRDILPFIIFISGSIFTFFITINIYIISQRTAIIQKIVEDKTKKLNEANIRLQEISRTDGLTNIANRRYMDESLDHSWGDAIRNKSSITFIMIDIDYFKLYNDNYGHQKGDECLKIVATKLKSIIHRPSDLVARYGGEEFALILPNTTQSQFMAEKCRASIKNMNIPHKFSKSYDTITISVGAATIYPTKNITSEVLIKAADKALYEAKEKGRNQVVIKELNKIKE